MNVTTTTPPVGNTGGKLTQSIGGDWLNLTFPAERRDEVKALVEQNLGKCLPCNHGIHTYREAVKWELGGMLAWTDGRKECFLTFNGDSMNAFAGEKLWRFVQATEKMNAKCTRIDLAFDDYTRSLFTMDDVREAAISGNFSGFARVDMQRPTRWMTHKKTDQRRPQLLGDSVTFGRKGKAGSGKQVVFYDKGLESGGRLNALRIEARFFKTRAQMIFEDIADADSFDIVNRKMRRRIAGAIDFVERAHHVHLKRMTRLAWWLRVVDVLGEPVKTTVKKIVPTLQGTITYMKKAFQRAFATLAHVVDEMGMDGRSVLHKITDVMIDDGTERYEDQLDILHASELDLVELLNSTTWARRPAITI